MNDSVHHSHQRNQAKRQLLFVLAAFVLLAGCGQPAAPVAIPFSGPDEFSDSKGAWERIEGEPTKTDNQLIGTFFEKHADLIGSPDWTGNPEKYICQKTKSLKRYYWFSGNEENPSWNAIEINGSQIKQLSGTGSPGTEIQD